MYYSRKKKKIIVGRVTLKFNEKIKCSVIASVSRIANCS